MAIEWYSSLALMSEPQMLRPFVKGVSEVASPIRTAWRPS